MLILISCIHLYTSLTVVLLLHTYLWHLAEANIKFDSFDMEVRIIPQVSIISVVENEAHFVFKSPLYNPIRDKFPLEIVYKCSIRVSQVFPTNRSSS